MADGVAGWSVDETAAWVSRQPLADVEEIVSSFRAEDVDGLALLDYGTNESGRKELKQDFDLSIGKAGTLWRAIRELSNGGAAESEEEGIPPTPSGFGRVE